jgi:hypothetical protein
VSEGPIEYQLMYSRPHGVCIERPYCPILDQRVNGMIYNFCAKHGCLNLLEQMLLNALQEQWTFEEYRVAARSLNEDGQLIFDEADCRRWIRHLQQPGLFDSN